jgi:hypothetical protein
MIIKLTKGHFEELFKKGFSLDYIFMLMLVKEGHNMDELTKDSVKLEAMRQTLVRKALISEESKLTPIGQELLDFMSSKISTPIVRKKASTEEFDTWWESFPSTDHFEYQGRIFTGSRGMRVQKEKCRLKFNAIVNEGVYTAKQIIEATKLVVLLKKNASIKKRTNELTYLQNSYTFLDKDHYVPFIEMLSKGSAIIEIQQAPTGGGTDI